MGAHPIKHYFDSAEDLLPIAREARSVQRLQQIYSRIAPVALVRASRIKYLRAGVLFVVADNAAVATKLQQLACRLLAAYQKQPLEVTSIHFEVQVASLRPNAGTKPAFRMLSTDTIDNLEQLAKIIEDVPLKRALTKLIEDQRECVSESALPPRLP
jgi:hypothetical protein